MNRKTFMSVVLASMLSNCLLAQQPEEQVEKEYISAAMKRYKGHNTLNELYTRFSYSPVEGIGFDPVVGRRDPSTIVKVDSLYYVWYTRCTDPMQQWLNADIWYATSPDGYKWAEKGPAVERGPKGSWDDYSVFTTNILVAEGKYYLVYQAETMPHQKTFHTINTVGMAWAESPDGPWTKLKDPVLKPTPDANVVRNSSSAGGDPSMGWNRGIKVVQSGSFDSKNVHDPGILVYKGKYYLYYKGHGWDNSYPDGRNSTHPADTKWGVAIADKPEGPYVKSPYNPVITSGHEVWMFPWKNGIAALCDFAGPEAHTAQYSEDGINFFPVAALEDLPPAGGAYIPDKFADNGDGKGFSWGLCHVGGRIASPRNFLVRFDCDLERGKPKDISWARYELYSTVREVLLDPERFGLPCDVEKRQWNRKAGLSP